MACGCGCGNNKNNDHFLEAQAGGTSQDQDQGGTSQDQDQDFTIAGFNWWIVLLFAGAVFTILNWDQNQK